MEAVFQDEVRRAKDAGRSILLSSHILSEVEKLCDTVTIIRQGVAVESGTLAELRHLTRTHVDATIRGSVTLGDGAHDLETSRTDTGTRLTFTADDTALPRLLATLAAQDIVSLTATPPSLEELFLRHYGDELDAERELAS